MAQLGAEDTQFVQKIQNRKIDEQVVVCTKAEFEVINSYKGQEPPAGVPVFRETTLYYIYDEVDT